MRSGMLLFAVSVIVLCSSQASGQGCGNAIYSGRPMLSPVPVSVAGSAYQVSHGGTGVPIASAVPRGYTLPAASAYARPVYSAYYPVVYQPVAGQYSAVPYRTYRPLPPAAAVPGSVVGRGLLGQPKAYVPGQPLRNFMRYLTP